VVATAESVPLDDDVQDALLGALLDEHPDAVVSAIDDHGRLVPRPASLALIADDVLATRSALDLLAAGSRLVVVGVWDQAKRDGKAAAPVQLVNGADAVLHLVDVRHRHGVLIGMLVTDADAEVLAALTDRSQVMPKMGSVVKDEMGVIRSADDHICQILGVDVAELVGTRSLDWIHPDDHLHAVEMWMEMILVPGGTTRSRARHRRRDGSWLWMELTNSNRLERAEACVITEMLDVSDEVAARESLRQREELLGRLTEALPLGVVHVNRQRGIVYANDRLRDVVGVSTAATIDEQLATVIPEDHEAVARAIRDVLGDGVNADLEMRVRMPGTSNVHLCAVAVRVLTDANGAAAGAVLCINDITEAAELRKELERRATVDELTGCFNRAAIRGELDRILRRHAADSPGTAIVYLDLDDFKAVNDTYGHEAGDKLLTSVVSRLNSVLRVGDVIGRLGGDEFIVVLPHIDDIDHANHVCSRLLGALTEPESVDGRSLRIRCSVGVAWASAPDITSDALTAAADGAMYTSKRLGNAEPVFVTLGHTTEPEHRP
jgi:diguanylate cyclase (GGDEF)-like protein/PAS domain S-box-containing protein